MEFKNEIIDNIVDAIVNALMDGAEEIAEESKEQVPKKSGALKESCKVEATGRMDISVGYDLPYAAKVHENLQNNYKNGKAKYLEDPFNAKAEDIIEGAANAIMRVI